MKDTPRPVRYNTPGHAHGLTFSCYKNKPFLNSVSIKQILADSINRSRVKHSFEVWAYVFMPEHVHLLIYPWKEIYSISDILKSMKQSSSRRIIGDLRVKKSQRLVHLETGIKGRRYRFWQTGGGYDRNFYTSKEILKQMNYIHNNPIEGGLVESSLDWYWSSARFWETGEEGPVVVEHKYLDLM